MPQARQNGYGAAAPAAGQQATGQRHELAETLTVNKKEDRP